MFRLFAPCHGDVLNKARRWREALMNHTYYKNNCYRSFKLLTVPITMVCDKLEGYCITPVTTQVNRCRSCHQWENRCLWPDAASRAIIIFWTYNMWSGITLCSWRLWGRTKENFVPVSSCLPSTKTFESDLHATLWQAVVYCRIGVDLACREVPHINSHWQSKVPELNNAIHFIPR